MTHLDIPVPTRADATETGPLNARSARSPWTWPISFVLAATLLYFALRGVQWRRVWVLVSGCQVEYLALGCLLAVLAYIGRAMRWRILLSQRQELTFSTVFWANSVGQLGNSFLPARAGELVRTALITSRSRLANTYVLTTALAERVVDMILLVMFASVLALTIKEPPAWLARVSVGGVVVGLIGAIFLFLLPKLETSVKAAIARLPVSVGWQDRLAHTASNVGGAIHTFRSTTRFLKFAILTIAVWLLDSTGTVILARALGMHLSLALALILFTALAIGMSLPSTPGAVGIVQFVAVAVLVPFNFTQTAAIAFILVSQAASYVIITTLGLIGLWQYRRTGAQGVPNSPSIKRVVTRGN